MRAYPIQLAGYGSGSVQGSQRWTVLALLLSAD